MGVDERWLWAYGCGTGAGSVGAGKGEVRAVRGGRGCRRSRQYGRK